MPEIWIAFAEASGIPELRRTTRDEPDYDKLMRWRLGILKEHGLGLKEIQATIAKIDPLPGAKAFLDELRSYGVPFAEGDDAGVVCVGFDTTLTYEKLDRAVHFLRRGAAFVAANPDWVCPMAAGEVMPDCGSICALLTASTGVKPLYIGKPNRSMVDIISGFTGVPNAEICCVGDRLYTDIAVAVNAGAQSVLVMSGETTPEILAESATKPGWVMADVAELARVLEG